MRSRPQYKVPQGHVAHILVLVGDVSGEPAAEIQTRRGRVVDAHDSADVEPGVRLGPSSSSSFSFSRLQ